MTRACCSTPTHFLHQGWKWVRAISHTSPLCLHRHVKEWNGPFPIIMLSIYSTWYALPNLKFGLTPQHTVGKQNRCIFSKIFHTFLLGSTSSGHAEIQTHAASPSSVNSQTRPAPQCFFAHGSAEYKTRRRNIHTKTYASTSINLFYV